MSAHRVQDGADATSTLSKDSGSRRQVGGSQQLWWASGGAGQQAAKPLQELDLLGTAQAAALRPPHARAMPPTRVSPFASGTPSPSPSVPQFSPWDWPPLHGQRCTSGARTHRLLASAPQVASRPPCTPCGLSIGSLLAPLVGCVEPPVYHVARACRSPSQAQATTAPTPVATSLSTTSCSGSQLPGGICHHSSRALVFPATGIRPHHGAQASPAVDLPHIPSRSAGFRPQLTGAGNLTLSSLQSRSKNQAALHSQSADTGTARSLRRPPRTPLTVRPMGPRGRPPALAPHNGARSLGSVADVQRARASTPPQSTPKQTGPRVRTKWMQGR
ncbi:hypothetical protein NDU88_010654 [Pleurodeles waltl]|uniref:Uncharacterized protein n=1 Tax=Pleurodeles waltl TaxID=8319 RepID=A0AAV7S1F9_PLEWA|nr:hypothetical protein NDU88_010654 [Pleurodeles waltl]